MKVVSTVYDTKEMDGAEFTIGLFEDEFGHPLVTADGKVVGRVQDLLPLLERTLASRREPVAETLARLEAGIARMSTEFESRVRQIVQRRGQAMW